MLEFVKKNGMFSNVAGFKRVIYKWSNDNNNGIDNDKILKMMTLKIMIMTKTMTDKTQKQWLKNNKQKYDTHSNNSLLYCTRLRIQTSE